MPAPTRPPVPRPRRAIAALLVAAIAAAAPSGCASGGPAASPAAAAPATAPQPADAGRPLEGLTRGGGLIFPVQRLELAAGVSAPAGGSDALLRALDAEVAFALEERGLGTAVATAAVAERLARSNPTYAADPRALPVTPGRALEAGDEVGEPLASQIRAVAALADRRHVVLPLALRVEPAEGGAASAVLRLALVDVRMAKVLWAGTTAAAVGPYPSAALAPRVAARFADLLAAPSEP